MSGPAYRRRLAAIVVADVAGYSRLMEVDEEGTMAAIRQRRAEIIEPVVARHSGRVISVAGDGVLVEFASAVAAVEAALDLQSGFATANAEIADDRRMQLRIGVNLGEVVGEGADIYGSGVNIAARLEQLCEPNQVYVSAKVRDEVEGKSKIRFEDLGQHALKNIADPVRVYVARRTGEERIAPAQSAGTSARPSIAVLPFVNMSGDASQQYLADGITEDLTTELSRFRGLEVASRLAAFHFAGQGFGPEAVARQLGVGYFVEGSVRKMGPRIRVTAQLIDAKSGSHVWAERYDRDAEDIFGVQDEVIAAIVANLEGRVTAAGAALARKKPTESWSAYDCLLQGRELTNEYREPEAVPHFRRAIAIDPNFALAHAWLAVALTISDMILAEDGQLSEANAASMRALTLDEGDATAHYARALVLHWSGDYERAGQHFERAMRLNPSDVQIQGDYANWQRMSGREVGALTTIDRAIALGPFVPRWFSAVRGEVLFDQRRYQEALAALQGVPEHYVSGRLHLAAARAMLGDKAGASVELERALALRPGLSLGTISRRFRYLNAVAQEHFIGALRLAGMAD